MPHELGHDPHKAMLKKSKRLGKKLLGKKAKKKSFKERTKNLVGYEKGGAMFSADAWKAD